MRTSGLRRAWPWWRRVLTTLSALGLALSAYLSWHYLVGGSVIGCGPGAPGCEQVLASRWSAIAGVLPVSGLAAGVYLAILVASLFIGPTTAASDRRLAWGAMLVMAGAAAGSAIWFTIVQKWMIGAFCPYCMATHITGLMLAALVIWKAPLQCDSSSTDVALTSPAPAPGPVVRATQRPHRALGRLPAGGLALVGLVLAGVMATAQLVFTSRAVHRGGESQHHQLAIDPRAVPLAGSPDAPYVVSLLFDYQCPHCQQLHFMLDEAMRRYGGKLAFALCPTPLSSQCNPYVPRDVDHFKDSCELAKTGLAVWLAKREAFGAFDRWMFSLESGDRWHPRSLDAAKAKAVELVGQARFDAARADPWIDRYLQSSIRIYGDTGGDAIPKLVFGAHWVTPQPYDADELVSILHDSLAIPRPEPAVHAEAQRTEHSASLGSDGDRE